MTPGILSHLCSWRCRRPGRRCYGRGKFLRRIWGVTPLILENIIPILWLRYVDDVFSLYPHDDQSLELFLTQLNSLVPPIKFTKEEEQNGILPFLDVKVHRRECGFRFSIYRKPTHSESCIHFFSFHPLSVKKSVAAGLLPRALRYCDPEFIEQEMDHLFKSFQKLRYPQFVIQQVLSRARRSFYLGPSDNNHNRNILKLPYMPALAHLKHTLKSQDINLVFSQNNTIRNKLVKNSHTNNASNSGVYVIPCHDCDNVYVGETGRPLETQIREHKYACRTNTPNSAIAKHTLEIGHRINFKDTAVVCNVSNIAKRRIIEGALIHHLPTFPGNTALVSDNVLISRMIFRAVPLKYEALTNLLPNISPDLLTKALSRARYQNPP